MTTYQKPFTRLWRPMKNYNVFAEICNNNSDHNSLKSIPTIDYLRDGRFADQSEKKSLITSAHLIIKDLYELFYYIEPCNNNKFTYSHRIYELFLRTCTEIEANFKGILSTNLYKKQGDFNMRDYFKVEDFSKLSEYEITFERWKEQYALRPFEQWNSTTNQSLPWYQAYNNVKHNRYNNFTDANFDNLMNSIGALLIVLHAQYGEDMAETCFSNISLIQNNQYEVHTDTFILKTPLFTNEEYDFIWDDIKNETDPVTNYKF